MSDIVIGMGQIGIAVAAVTESRCTFDSAKGAWHDPGQIDVMHICIPYSDDFIAAVRGYAELIKPEHIAIWSTVPIGTTSSINDYIVHTPVEGKHPDLELSIRQMERWLGAGITEEGVFFSQYFKNLGLKTKVVPDARFTEALKLLSTTEYGVNIEFARYKKMVADSIEMPYELTKDWNRAYNKLYRDLGMEDRFQKFVLDAPDGPKGGHCVQPNAELLNSQFPNELVEIVSEL